MGLRCLHHGHGGGDGQVVANGVVSGLVGGVPKDDGLALGRGVLVGSLPGEEEALWALLQGTMVGEGGTVAGGVAVRVLVEVVPDLLVVQDGDGRPDELLLLRLLEGLELGGGRGHQGEEDDHLWGEQGAVRSNPITVRRGDRPRCTAESTVRE